MKPRSAAQSSPKSISYEPLFWLFMAGNLLGVLLEGVWCLAVHHHWETHVTTIWGPFNVVYGVGAVCMYLAAAKSASWRLWQRFLLFTGVGTVVEWLVAIIQERVFHAVSWDYSSMRFSLGGRISLLMSLIWGVLDLLFSMLAVPLIDRCLARTESALRRKITFALCIYMSANLALSLIILVRWGIGRTGTAEAGLLRLLDLLYPSDYLSRRFVEWVLL